MVLKIRYFCGRYFVYHNLKITIMLMFIRNDYGTVQVSFAGLSLYMCDEGSCKVFDNVKRILLRGGDVYSLDYFTLDTNDGVVSVFTLGNEDFVPTIRFSVRFLFEDNKSYLLKLYNLFAAKKRCLSYDDYGKAHFGGSNNSHNGKFLERPCFDK